MRKRLISLIMAVCMLFSLIPVASAEENPVTVTILGMEDATYAAEVFDLVNQAREEHGKAPVTRNATLSELAMLRAAEIALYYSHTRPDGTSCYTALDGTYTGWSSCGENIAINQRGASAVMEDWMNSQGHRENILSSDFTQIGIGCFYADGVYTWVQLFGNSTSNTAETTRTGETDVMVDIQILPSNLSVETLAVMDLEMRPGQTHTIIIEAVNPQFVQSSPALIVEDGNATDENGIIIATYEADPLDGSVVITAVNSGTAVVEIPAYEGQPDPVSFTITVPDEGGSDDPFQPQPTEPVPTEPQPTEPTPTEPNEDIIASGQCGENAAWVLDKNGTLTISGTGGMAGGSGWADYKDQILRLVVEEGITGISNYAFSHCENLVAATLPDSVTTLGCCAFEHCYSLVSIELPDTMEQIDLGCFRECTSLVTVRVPDGIQYIGDEIFSNCTALQALTIPDTVTGMEGNALWGCPNVVLYCYEMSYAHLFALQREYPFQLMEDRPGTPTYSVNITCGPGGSAAITPNPSPANRYVLLEAAPDKGYALDHAYYLCVSAPGTELEFQAVGENQYLFFMPQSDVELEVYFRPTESPFSDVKKDAFYYEPVLWAVSYGITSGISQTRFAPNDPCTRAQVVTFLWRAAGEPEPVSTRNPFKDVSSSAYYYKAVLWAVENGITTGMSANTFAPNSPCTRGQVVTFLWRAAGEPGVYYNINPFRDVASSAFYYDAVLWAVENGITAGMSETTFAPGSTCTRGQVVTFLYRFAN